MFVGDDPVNQVDPSGKMLLVALGDSSITQGALRSANVGLAQVTRNRIAGKALEGFVEQQLLQFTARNAGSTLLRQVYIKGPGGKRFADFVVQMGDRFIAIEVKTKFPLGGSSLVRLGNQLKSFVLGTSPTIPGTAAEVIVITEQSVAALEASFIAVEAQVATGTLAGVLQGTSGLMAALRAILLGL